MAYCNSSLWVGCDDSVESLCQLGMFVVEVPSDPASFLTLIKLRRPFFNVVRVVGIGCPGYCLTLSGCLADQGFNCYTRRVFR